MRIKKETFIAVLGNLQKQHDKEVERAKILSDIYGSDINPNDNSLLVESIFLIFKDVFNNDQIETIQFFCFDQNFGRIDGLKSETLWNKMLGEIEVKDAETL